MNSQSDRQKKEEWWDLYDQEDRIIGRHLRGEKMPEGSYHHLVTVITINSKKELLLTKRALTKSYGGEWETTAGSVLEHETEPVAAARELMEETGIVCREEDLIPLGILETTDRKAWMYGYALRKDVAIEDIRLQEGETIDARWVPLEWSLVTDTSLAEPVRIRLIYYWQQLESVLDRGKHYEPWLDWTKKLQAIAQIGLEYTKDDYDRERFDQISRIASEILAYKTGISPAKVLDLFANERGYQTPKAETRAAVIRNGRILLVQERKTELWSLPGGWCDIGLSLAENTEKECWEEAGLIVQAKRVIAIENRSAHDYTPYPYEIYKFYLLCEEAEGEKGAFRPNTETLDARFFAPDNLPPLARDRVTERSIQMCFDAYRDENWTLRFD